MKKSRIFRDDAEKAIYLVSAIGVVARTLLDDLSNATGQSKESLLQSVRERLARMAAEPPE